MIYDQEATVLNKEYVSNLVSRSDISYSEKIVFWLAEGSDLDWQDVLYVLKQCREVSGARGDDFYIITGDTLDDVRISIAIVIQSEGVTVTSIWRS